MSLSQFLPAFAQLKTPFYFYDIDLLQQTMAACKKEMNRYGYHAHYALKANNNEKIVKLLRDAGFGADCVSGNEVLYAVKNGFAPKQIVYSGVGKTDEEINHAIAHDIFCINCESVQELEVVNALAAKAGKVVDISIRLNPDIDPHTHEYITTGLEENKFGISEWEFNHMVERLQASKNLRLIALHAHVGSQITDMPVFEKLCYRINELQQVLADKGVTVEHLNMGGGLGVNYEDPEGHPIADFAGYFAIFHKHLSLRPGQTLHFEPGRPLVAQCASLITRVLYVKNGQKKNFVVVDGGMTDLLRPALYQAQHAIRQLSSDKMPQAYDVVGPICESADCFGKNIMLPQASRGDFIALRTAGAYGQTMCMRYNLRDLPPAVYSDELPLSV